MKFALKSVPLETSEVPQAVTSKLLHFSRIMVTF